MKLATTDTNIQTGGRELVTAKFGIGNLGLVMKIFRELMYKDPVRAICREISCNARDAHREIGAINEPIEIHLPSKFDKSWKVKDWGPGISPDRMENIFLQYGNSTKREDNDQTGGWGLGAKTPFSKTNQFTISTITHDEDGINRKRVWIAHIDETDQGMIRCLKEHEVDEPTGTEIIVPVQDKDFEEFIDGTIKATTHWDVRPNLIGMGSIPEYPEKNEILLEGDGWKLYTSRESYDQYDTTVILDGMAYPLDPDSLGGRLSRSDSQLFSKNLELFFDVGEIVPAPNREHLHYDDNTRDKINERVKAIRESITEKMVANIAEAKSYKEAVLYFESFKGSMRFAIPEDYEASWNGHELKKSIYKRNRNTDGNDLKVRVDYFTHYQSNKSYNTVLGKKEENHIDIRKDAVIYYNDLNKNRISRVRIKKILETSQMVQLITFQNGDIKGGIDAWKNLKNKDGTPSSCAFDLTLLEPNNLSSIDIPKKTRKNGLRNPRRTDFDAFILEESYKGHRNCDNNWEPNALLKKAGTGTYVVLHGNNKAGLASGNKTYIMTDLLLAQCVLGDDEAIFGIKEASLKHLGKNWRPLHEVLRERAEEIKQHEDIESFRDDIEAHVGDFRFMKRFEEVLTDINNKHGNELLNSSALAKYFKEMGRVSKITNESRNIVMFIDLVDGAPENYIDPEKSILGKLHDELTKRYPLIDAIDHWNAEDYIKDILSYIKAMDFIYENNVDISSTVAKLAG